MRMIILVIGIDLSTHDLIIHQKHWIKFLEIHCTFTVPVIPWYRTSVSFILYLHWSYGGRTVSSIWSYSLGVS
ncbi:hypothetical protein Fmac_021129 [Flemingia macrophylla]|uniref:Uncharacterized protein n=1 Tax=Flemingia macrophylla TaxID=520843 RepID=A0ABD1LVZ2_9FABA